MLYKEIIAVWSEVRTKTHKCTVVRVLDLKPLALKLTYLLTYSMEQSPS